MIELDKKAEYIKNEKELPCWEVVLRLKKSVLIKELFSIEGVTGLSYNTDISITNNGDSYHFAPSVEWSFNKKILGENFDTTKTSEIAERIESLDDELIQHLIESIDDGDRERYESTVYSMAEDALMDMDILKKDLKESLEILFNITTNQYLKTINFDTFISDVINEEESQKKVIDYYGIEINILPTKNEDIYHLSSIYNSLYAQRNNFYYEEFKETLKDVFIKASEVNNPVIEVSASKIDKDLVFYLNNEQVAEINFNKNKPKMREYVYTLKLNEGFNQELVGLIDTFKRVYNIQNQKDSLTELKELYSEYEKNILMKQLQVESKQEKIVKKRL